LRERASSWREETSQKQIAQSLGYKDVASFARVFRKAVGSAPGAYPNAEVAQLFVRSLFSNRAVLCWALVRASAIEYTASEAPLSEDFIMISRRQAFAVTILGLIGGSTVALAQTKKGSAPVSQFDTDSDGTVDIDEAKNAASDLFDKLDTDKEGTISVKELHGRLSSKDFSGADPDKDKTLTKDEYLTVV
jgi:hypothetical protein